ncbi:hypothetical protein [Microvirga sp. VF16]|uniref:hypothetical protein n=1 Tax=Microvirga sp. VF16 TaxID=2807101 RepID=UPI00193CB72D|nr:hypothetical protein [Microvirga sp. VF16]QRM30845.1 hypothetical protein JO965_07585 [Microvirga sp. VF16]
MKKLLIAASTLAFLAAAPLTAQAATSGASAMPSQNSKHATVRHHTAAKKGHINEAKKNVSCPAGSTNAACHPSSTGAIR